MSMKSRRRFTLSAGTAVLLGFTSLAFGHGNPNRFLRGDYAFTQVNSCMSSAMLVPGAGPTFDPNDPVGPLLGDATSSTLALTGTSRFDGKGNWTLVDGRSLVIDHGPAFAGDSPIRTGDFTCVGSYTAQKDRSFKVRGTCTLDGGFPLHFDPLLLDGEVSVDRKTLILHQTTPTIEQITFGKGGPKLGERVCSAVAVDVRAVARD